MPTDRKQKKLLLNDTVDAAVSSTGSEPKTRPATKCLNSFSTAVPVTPHKDTISNSIPDEAHNRNSLTKRRLLFGKYDVSSETTVSPLIERMYRDNQRYVHQLGDSASDDPMNGEFTKGSTQRLLHKIKEHMRLDEIPAVFADIGSGSGKIVMHAAACSPNLVAVGIEVSRVRYIVSLLCQRDSLQRADEYANRVHLMHADILTMQSLGAVTHVYAASAAFPDHVMLHLAKMWDTSLTAQFLVCNHNPRQMITDYGFKVKDMAVKVSATMYGSGEGKTFYFYERLSRSDGSTERVNPDGTQLMPPTDLDDLTKLDRADRLRCINEVLHRFMHEPPTKRSRRVSRYPK